jgi:hypothetical protein
MATIGASRLPAAYHAAMPVSPSKASLQRRLARFYRRNAYVREPRGERVEEGRRSYRKGWEVRFVLRDLDEVAIVEKLLRELGFNPGRPFPKHSRWVVPAYGEEAVKSLRAWADGLPEDG